MITVPVFGRARNWVETHPVKTTTISGLTVQVGRPLVTLVTLPLLLHALGEGGLGVWLIAISMMGIFSFVSAGISSCVITYVSRISGASTALKPKTFAETTVDAWRNNPNARSDDIRMQLSQLTTISFLIATACAALLYVLVLPAALLLDWAALLKLEDPALSPDVRRLVAAIVVVLGLSVVAVIPRQIMFGRLHGYLAHSFDFVGILLGASGLIAAIHLGSPMWVMALAFTGPSVAFLFLGGLYYLARAGIRPFSPGSFDSRLFRRVRDDALRMGGYHAAFTISSQTDIILIGIILGATATVDFGVAQRIFSLLILVGLVVNHAQWPVLARTDAAGDHASFLPLFRRTLTLMPLGAGLFAICLVLAYEPLIALWLGETCDADPLILWGMVAWVCVATASNTCDSLLRARNETSFLMHCFSAMAIINLGLTLLLLPLIGPAGAIWGSAIAYFMAVLIPYLWRLRADIWERAPCEE